jgi:lipid-binding SYLF domain-containing protein
MGLGMMMALVAAGSAPSQTREIVVVDTSTAVFQEIMSIPERSIPPALVSGAHAIAIVPNVLKAGFLVGGRFGRGVLLVRDASGGWSNPIFLTIGGGSFGFQIGAQATDLILVFKNQRSLRSFLGGKGKVTLGADASAAAGPVGRTLSAGTDVTLASEILTYSRSRGLFAGISLEGAVLSLDWQANVAFYGKVISPGEILAGANLTVPQSAVRLKAWLDHYTTPPAPARPALPGDGLPPSQVPADSLTPVLPAADPAVAPTVLRSTPVGVPGAGGSPAAVHVAQSADGTDPAWKRAGAEPVLVRPAQQTTLSRQYVWMQCH